MLLVITDCISRMCCIWRKTYITDGLMKRWHEQRFVSFLARANRADVTRGSYSRPSCRWNRSSAKCLKWIIFLRFLKHTRVDITGQHNLILLCYHSCIFQWCFDSCLLTHLIFLVNSLFSYHVNDKGLTSRF